MNNNERKSAIMFSLNLGFSDVYDDENVRQFTLHDKLDEMEGVVTLLSLATAINFSIFNSDPDDPTSEIYTVDFPSDLTASIYEVLGGYYRQAILILRSWMELRLTGIYYSFINPNRQEYDDWSNGNLEAPYGRGLIRQLFSRHEFRNVDPCLRTRLDTLYGELCTFVHGGGLKKYELYRQNDNVPRYNPDSFNLWNGFLHRVFAELTLCFYVAYGQDAFNNLHIEEREKLKEILPESHRGILEKEGVL